MAKAKGGRAAAVKAAKSRLSKGKAPSGGGGGAKGGGQGAGER